MIRQPFPFRNTQIFVCLRAAEVLVMKLLGIILVFILYLIQCSIKLVQQISPFFIDNKEKIRRA